MRLLYFNEKLDLTIEHEIIYDIDDNPYGFNVIVTYKDSYYSPEIYNNVTEIHYLYNNEPRIAFESDIHHTGLTRYINDYNLNSIIESVVILKSNKFEEELQSNYKPF